MSSLLVFGAGKSATVLIDYLVQACSLKGFSLEVVDAQPGVANAKLQDSCQRQGIDGTSFIARSYDIHSVTDRESSITNAEVVISLLPPHLHSIVAGDCIRLKRSLFTASYVDPSIQQMASEIEENGLLFLYEMGLDPGIDHMSLMELLEGIRAKGGVPTGIRSHCGGLVAPESDDNPWHYKISWNPRNVVMAGVAGAQYLENDQVIEKKHAQLFREQHLLRLDQVGEFAYYPNRDSLSYIDRYGLQGIASFQRTTLRHPAFMKGWNAIVELGMIDDKRIVELKPGTTLAAGLNACVGLPDTLSSDIRYLLDWLGWDDHQTLLPFASSTPASILQFAMENKWVLKPTDKDQIVMVHEIEYQIDGKTKYLKSWLIDTGLDAVRTAMARTVGLPIGMAAVQFLEKRWTAKGLQIPTLPTIYEPVLTELRSYGLVFHESEN